jgi:hypothetical protein
MLLIPIVGPNIQNTISDKIRSKEISFSEEELSKLKSISVSEWANSLFYSNSEIATLTDMELILNKFVHRFFGLISGLYSLKKPINVNIALPAWRALFEVSVVFRVLIQPLVQNNDKDTFFILLSRFRDFGLIKDSYSSNDPKIVNLKIYYNKLPKNEKLELEYDWLNPVFPDLTAKRFRTPYSPSFRDLLNRTRESNSDFIVHLPFYEKASDIIHFNYFSDSISKNVKEEDLNKLIDLIARIFLVDYLKMIISLYSSHFEDKNELSENEILKMAESLISVIQGGGDIGN